ncbi:MAG: hypothetical protein KAX51_04500 [Chromatiaceae bacterium]|nr:hypothetical protein [Chromatiaceae bacterium]MBP8289057.1 hypothetical protein [Chromatiaceae bacterium]
MAVTANITVIPNWSVLVAAGDEFIVTLASPTRFDVEVATTDSAGTAPAVAGHLLNGDQPEGLTRSLLGPGTVWARTRGGSVAVVVNAWTP